MIRKSYRMTGHRTWYY